VRRIVKHCAGLPLALAIVGSRGQLHPETSLARIADELGRLDDEDPANSVPAALSWSLRALTRTQSRLLGLLAAAPGPDIGPAALASLAGPESDLPALERLCLLERVAGGRYRMHDLLRAQVRAEDVEATRRVIDHYLYTADSADRLLQPYGAPAELPPMSRGAGRKRSVASMRRWPGSTRNTSACSPRSTPPRSTGGTTWSGTWRDPGRRGNCSPGSGNDPADHDHDTLSGMRARRVVRGQRQARTCTHPPGPDGSRAREFRSVARIRQFPGDVRTCRCPLAGKAGGAGGRRSWRA
jgi:hypothetical protein